VTKSQQKKVEKKFNFFKVPNSKTSKGPLGAKRGLYFFGGDGVTTKKKTKWTKDIDKVFQKHLKCPNPISSQLTYFLKFIGYKDPTLLNHCHKSKIQTIH